MIDPTVVAFTTIAMSFVLWMSAIVLSVRARIRGESTRLLWLDVLKIVAIAMIQFAVALLLVGLPYPEIRYISIVPLVLGLFWILFGYRRIRARSRS